ncbi:MAG: radical SAM protein [Planctomycetes bacterium]|nr:radical SAM protein [Planctomycetota bacterium]
MTEWLEQRSILTPTGGFLAAGYTHTLNPYSGCSFAGGVCGVFCYAQHNGWITRGRPWGLYGAKREARALYARDFDRLRCARAGPRPLRIYMSSSTDPYLPQEAALGVTRGVLEAMLERPPDVLVVQTRAPLVTRDLDLLVDLSRRCDLWLSMTVETDLARVPGLPPHATPIAGRLDALAAFRRAGVRTQAAVSPLLPIGDLAAFAARLDAVCDRVVVDHYLVGDGSQGLRTRRTPFVDLLLAAGHARWTRLEALEEVRAGLAAVLGEARVLVSCDGFNAVGPGHQERSVTSGGQVT